MLFLWASLPVDLPVPSLRISTGIFPPACAILFTYEMMRQDRLGTAVISFVKVGAGNLSAHDWRVFGVLTVGSWPIVVLVCLRLF